MRVTENDSRRSTGWFHLEDHSLQSPGSAVKKWEGSALETILSPSSGPQLGCVWASPEALFGILVLSLNPESYAVHLVTLWTFQFVNFLEVILIIHQD